MDGFGQQIYCIPHSVIEPYLVTDKLSRGLKEDIMKGMVIDSSNNIYLTNVYLTLKELTSLEQKNKT